MVNLSYEDHEIEEYSLSFWRLCDELNIIQAALLVVGLNPSNGYASSEQSDYEYRPAGYEAVKKAISDNLRKGVITGELVPIYETDINGNRAGCRGGMVRQKP